MKDIGKTVNEKHEAAVSETEIRIQLVRPILHALRLIFDSTKLTEQFVAEYRLAKVAERMREIRLSYEALYGRLVDLGIAPAAEGDTHHE